MAVGVGILATCAVVLVLAVCLSGGRERIDARLKELAEEVPGTAGAKVAALTRSTLGKIGQPLLPGSAEDRTRLQTQLMQAGLYAPHALITFLGVKMVLMLLPAAVGFVAGVLGTVPMQTGVCWGLIAGTGGMIGPSFWLGSRKNARQAALRRALPDALDVIVICLEGGLSLPVALQRVCSELRLAHPLLSDEMAIVEREMAVGIQAGEALRHFADRCDLDDVRSLAAVVIQSERFGVSMVKTLKQHSETLRHQRLMRGEEQAQKAAVKIVFPTLLFIFPAVFLVLAGPAVIQVYEMMSRMNGGK
jgi:tight adherence protein C